MTTNRPVRVVKATLQDVEGIKALLDDFANTGDLLARSRLSLYENIRDFFVVREGAHVVGCSALHICWNDLAEVRSLAVQRTRQGQGLGRLLVQGCVAEARELGLKRLFALTYRTEFFSSVGFHQLDKSQLPHKVWQDCVHCPKFPDCDENAVVLDLTEEEPAGEEPPEAA